MSDKLRVILVGTGGFGNAWVKALAEGKEDVEIAGLVDVSAKALSSAAEKLGVKTSNCHTDLAEAMKSLTFDAAILCVPPGVRPPIYRRLMEAGKHILCEKPLSDSMEAAREALALKRRTGVHFVVSQNYRYVGGNQALKATLSGGRYGRPGACQIDFFLYPRFFGFREEMPYPLIIDMSIHHFDLVRFILGADPVSVIGRSWNGPWSVMKGDASSSLIFELSGGVFCSYNSSWTTLRPPPHQTTWNGTWYIECERGAVVYKEDKVTGWTWQLDAKGQPSWGEAQPAGDAPAMGNSQLHVLKQFVAQVRDGSAAPTTIEDNIKSVAMVFAAVKAFQTQSKVDIQAMLG